MARTARATGVGEAILLRVLDLQRGAFSASLQSRSSRPGWVLPNWPEVVRSLRPTCRALRAQIVDILGLWAAANLEAAEERYWAWIGTVRSGSQLRSYCGWLPDSQEALILRRPPHLELVMDHGWPVAVDDEGVAHVTPICPACGLSSWESLRQMRISDAGNKHLCWLCRHDMRPNAWKEFARKRKDRLEGVYAAALKQ